MVYAFHFAELNAFMGGSSTAHLGGYKSFSTKGKAFKLIHDKDTPFRYDDTKFQTGKLNSGKVMGSLVHPGNRHISKNFLHVHIHKNPPTGVYQRPLYSNSMQFHVHHGYDCRERRCMNFVLAGFKVGVKCVSFRGCFSALPIVAKIKFLYKQTAKEILGTYSQN